MASEDLPDPLGPLQTVILWRGMSTSTPLRLCWRAPRTAMSARNMSDDFFDPFDLPFSPRRGRGGAPRRSSSGPDPVWLAATAATCLRRPFGDDPPSACAPLGAHVDDPVGRLHDVEVVLDHDHRVAQGGEAVEDFEELADVVEMQARRRLVEDVERPARPPSSPARGPA